MTRISIILPAKNEADGLRKTLPALRDAIPGAQVPRSPLRVCRVEHPDHGLVPPALHHFRCNVRRKVHGAQWVGHRIGYRLCA